MSIIQGDSLNNTRTKIRARGLATNKYGTPKTGLILPKSVHAKDDDDIDGNADTTNTIGAFFQPNTTPSDISTSTESSLPLISPLLNVNQSNLHDFSNSNTTTATDTATLLPTTNDNLILPNPSGNTVTDPFSDGTNINDTNSDVALDIASMYDPQIHLPHKPDFNDPNAGYEVGTPLGDELMRYVGVSGRGGMTVAEYMGRCLRDERFGYYTNPPTSDDEHDDDDDVFGDDDDGAEGDVQHDWDTIDGVNAEDTSVRPSTLIPDGEDHTTPPDGGGKEGRGHRIIGAAGDFTTAPEISQIFGECLTVWLLAQFETLGKPSRVQLVEIGPGRGTLICDVLRSARGIKGVGEDFVAALGRAHADDGGKVMDNGCFEGTTSVVNGVHLVEVSENLRTTQFEALEELELQMTKARKPQTTVDDNSIPNQQSSNLSFDLCKWKTKEEQQEEMEALIQKVRKRIDVEDKVDPTLFSEIMADKKMIQQQQQQLQQEGGGLQATIQKEGSIPVQWHNSFNSIPSSTTVPTFIIGQEILDALPVHVFQKTDDGWKERLVDVAIREDLLDDDNGENTNTSNAALVPMKNGSIANTSPAPTFPIPPSTTQPASNDKKPRFRYTLSPETTPALRALLHVDNEGRPTAATDGGTVTLDSAPVGTVLEVCPEAMLLAQDITSRIEACDGAALLIDYGNEGSGDTLRAFRRHGQVDVLSAPGTVDITADVDFAALKNAVNVGMAEVRNRNREDRDRVHADNDGKNIASRSGFDKDDNNVPIAFGPVCQGEFLASMGAVERTLNLIDDENTTDEQAEDLCKALERLVSEEEMGQRYKVMAIARKKTGIFPPPGFQS